MDRVKIAEALKDRFRQVISEHGGEVGQDRAKHVAMPDDSIWLGYADAVIDVLPHQSE